MFDFLLGVGKVTVSAWAMFTFVQIRFSSTGGENRFNWAMSTFTMAAIAVVIHRLLGNSVSIPIYASTLFILVLLGFDASFDDLLTKHLAKRASRLGISATIAGTLLGWTAFAETCDRANLCEPVLRPWF